MEQAYNNDKYKNWSIFILSLLLAATVTGLVFWWTGTAEGHNWWGVLYPGLCFGDAVNVVDQDGNREKIKNVLTEEEYSGVTAMSDFKISWYFWKGK